MNRSKTTAYTKINNKPSHATIKTFEPMQLILKQYASPITID